MPPRPDDSYNPLQQVSPTGAPQGDTLSVRATPNNFGAQVGNALQGAGKQIQGAGEDIGRYALMAQGLANEHEAQTAEMQLAVQGGEVYNKYRSLEGLDASNAKDGTIKDYISVGDKIRAGMSNPAAQRAYDQLATRRMSFVIQDMNSYAAEQQKQAYRQGNRALIEQSKTEAGTYEVATNPAQLADKEAGIIHGLNTDFTAPGYGKFQTIPVKQGPGGRLQYDTSTHEGQVAQATYNVELQKEVGEMYSNAIKIMATNPDPSHPGNVATAVDFMVKNQSKIPPKTYASLSAELSGPYRNEQTRLIAHNTEDEWDNKYNESLGNVQGPSYATNLGNVTIHGKAFANPTTPLDGVILAANNLKDDRYNGKTLAEIAPVWTKTEPSVWLKNVIEGSGKTLTPDSKIDANNPVFVKQFLRGLRIAEKSSGDQKAFSDDVITRGVEASFKGQQASLSPGLVPTLQGGLHQSKADFFGDHEDEILDSVRVNAEKHGYDTVGQDMAVDRMKARIAEVRSVQNNEVHSLTANLLQIVNDPKQSITNMNYLDHSTDPKIRNAWVQLQGLDPWKAQGIQRIVEANARGTSKTLGTDFYSHYADVLTGKVTDLANLQNYFGGDETPISNTGVKVLSQAIEDQKTPGGQGFASAEANFLRGARGTITGTSAFPDINPAVLKPTFDKYVMQVLPQIQAKKADMLSRHEDPAGMFNPESKDYIGKGIVAPDKSALFKAMSSSVMFNSGGQTSSTAPVVPVKAPEGYKTVEDIGKAYQSGKVTKVEVQEWIKGNGGWAPGVPRPN